MHLHVAERAKNGFGIQYSPDVLDRHIHQQDWRLLSDAMVQQVLLRHYKWTAATKTLLDLLYTIMQHDQ
jgi:hypothetical protein